MKKKPVKDEKKKTHLEANSSNISRAILVLMSPTLF